MVTVARCSTSRNATVTNKCVVIYSLIMSSTKVSRRGAMAQRGEFEMSRRLTVADVWAVRWKLRAGVRHVEIARELDLSVWTIARIDDDPRLNRDPVREED